MQKHTFIIALLLVPVLFLSSCVFKTGTEERFDPRSVTAAITAQYRRISPQLAKEMIDSGDPLVVVDVRTESEFVQGHIPGALLLPNEHIATLDITDVLPDKEATILVYCRSGNRSAQAARRLVSLGYINVYDFGGIIDWPYEITQ